MSYRMSHCPQRPLRPDVARLPYQLCHLLVLEIFKGYG